MSSTALVTGLYLFTGNGQNYLSWDATVGATSYVVQRSTNGVTFSTVATPAGNSYLDTTVSVGITYFYQVASVSGAGTSPYTASYPPSAVPCLPGQVNLSYLIYQARLKADKLFSNFLTPDEWAFNVNQSACELYDMLVTNYGEDYFFAPALLIQLTGDGDYPLPNGSLYSQAPACYKLNGIDLNIGGGPTGPNAQWMPMARFNWSDRDQWTVPGQVGPITQYMTAAYRVMGNRLHIRPVSTGNYIRLWYVPVLQQMLQPTDMLPFSISGWSEYVIIDAAIKALLKEEGFDQAAALQARKDALIVRIETAAKDRDVGQSNTVSNVRNTMSDPGFGPWGGGSGGGGFGWGG